MKKILLGLIVCVLISSLVQGVIHESGEGQVARTNMEEGIQMQNQIQVQSGNYSIENGKRVQVQEQVSKMFKLKSGGASADISMNMTQEQTQNGLKLRVNLSNGRNAEIKIMPDTASERALERLRLKVCSAENNCSIELKEVGQGEDVRPAYEVQSERHFKLLGMFQAKAQVKAQVDAESGEVIQVKKPWWAFLATEPEE